MNDLGALSGWIVSGVSPVLVLTVSIVAIWLVRRLIDRRAASSSDFRFRRQMATLLLGFVALLLVILASPLSDNAKNQLLSLIGVLLSAAIALSSATFVGNTFAGIMLRSIRSFRPGDYIIVGDHAGRVSDRGIFHVEIQTEDRTLTTLPNLYLVTNPVTVLPANGTIVAAEVSLGYEIPHAEVEATLLASAQKAGLKQAFVQLKELGDYSITYRVAGLLEQLTEIISARSRLRREMLDALHRDQIEIVSPVFLNLRDLDGQQPVIPPPESGRRRRPGAKAARPESVVFDKAEKASSIEQLREMYVQMQAQIDLLESQLDGAGDQRDELEQQIEIIRSQRKRLADFLEKQPG